MDSIQLVDSRLMTTGILFYWRKTLIHSSESSSQTLCSVLLLAHAQHTLCSPLTSCLPDFLSACSLKAEPNQLVCRNYSTINNEDQSAAVQTGGGGGAWGPSCLCVRLRMQRRLHVHEAPPCLHLHIFYSFYSMLTCKQGILTCLYRSVSCVLLLWVLLPVFSHLRDYLTCFTCVLLTCVSKPCPAHRLCSSLVYFLCFFSCSLSLIVFQPFSDNQFKEVVLSFASSSHWVWVHLSWTLTLFLLVKYFVSLVLSEMTQKIVLVLKTWTE